LKEYFSVLTWQDVFLAACLAYVITYIIRSFQRWIDRRVEKTFVVRSLDVPGVYEKCRELFPIEKITFQGKEFTRGMRVKVTTQHENIIEGELIGMNKMNLVCIRTNSQIIAHQLEKIQEIRSI
jgi:uncharacterized Fe-S cluster-containing radical SAM superfamily enzyme